jgi:hypothetical protein
MKQEIAEKWTAALRSGEYKQGAGALRTHSDCYCCLGVLCDLYANSGATFVENEPVEWSGQFGTSFLGQAFHLPPTVAEWAGMTQRNPAIDDSLSVSHELGRTLADINDNGMTFEKIADLIDKGHETF